MKRNHGLSGFAVLLIAAMFIFGGCNHDPRVPAEVGNLTATAGDGQVRLNWTDPPDYGFEKVVITYTNGAAQSMEAKKGVQTAVITGLTNGTPYTFIVRAVDTFGNISNGATVTATLGGGTEPGPDPELTGTVSISPNSSVTTGTQLNATYNGGENVSYQWNKDGTAITPGGTGTSYTPSAAGSYTVTVSAAGYQSKTSAAVTVSTPTYSIGDPGPGGGIIFYAGPAFTNTLTNTTCHYLEAAPGDITGGKWASTGKQTTDITGATGTAIGTGAANTAAILVADTTAPAALACRNYRGPNNKTDWFLPSIDELTEMYTQRATIGGFTNYENYWSSSQYTNEKPWYHRFTDPGLSPGNSNNKTITNSVRAIRAF